MLSSYLLVPFIKEAVISNTIAWNFINVLHLIGVLVGTTSLVEKLLVLRVVELIVL